MMRVVFSNRARHAQIDGSRATMTDDVMARITVTM